jgi:hypothetical protein
MDAGDTGRQHVKKTDTMRAKVVTRQLDYLAVSLITYYCAPYYASSHISKI